MMEAGYRGSGGSKGYFPQVSGFRICVDRSRDDFDRIISLQVEGDDGWGEIDSTTEYSLILPDFIYGDQDGYVMPAASRDTASPPGPELKYLVVDAIIKAQFVSKGVGVAVDPDNPRYVEISEQRPDCWR